MLHTDLGLKMADNLGEIFSMDSLIIYTRQIYLDRISELINSDIRNANKLNKLINLKTLKEMIAFAEEEKLQEGIRDTKAEKLLCYAAAEDMRKNGDRSTFMTRTAMRMMPKVVNAAKFLIKFELVR